ncbi:MAG: DNA polymerase/3'-5' exonuclease PolX [Phycisphaera sp.]|nr:DNA polymerase/3'-5' exonuclease PolX [Phycisphaera sp.]
MSTNSELARRFEQAAQVVELIGGNRFRANAFNKGARVIGDMTDDVASLADDITKLTAIDGIGKGLAEKIIEYVETGTIAELDELLADVPKGVVAMLDVPGLGPKKVATLWHDGGVESIEDLKAKIDAGELTDLPRMGAKTLDNIRKSLEFMASSAGRANIGDAMPRALAIVEAMKSVKGVTRIDYAGSLRRGRETIGDIDILCACDDPDTQAEAIGEAFRSLDIVTEVLAAGATKSSVRIEGAMQVDLRVVRTDRYGAALLYFTGSKDHNVKLRERAIKQELRLNEYGLWHSGDDKDDPKARPVAAKTEEDIYKNLHLAWIAPEMREDRGELDASADDKLPGLIEVKDIKAELHAHTTASDGKWSIEELAEAAAARGFHTVAVTDHSVSSAIANGLDPARLKKHIKAIRKAAEKMKDDITILAGSEVDILSDGRLDYEDALLAELDIVVASPHAALGQDPDTATKRLLSAIHNPYVHIIGHPTGRLINRREGFHPHMDQLFKAAAETGTTLEINASHYRLDLNDNNARAAIAAGCMLAIDTDAHGPGDLDELQYGITTARRAWAEPKHVVNCKTAKQLQTWLTAKRKHMGVV